MDSINKKYITRVKVLDRSINSFYKVEACVYGGFLSKKKVVRRVVDVFGMESEFFLDRHIIRGDEVFYKPRVVIYLTNQEPIIIYFDSNKERNDFVNFNGLLEFERIDISNFYYE